jgi:hypothetical protein
MRSTFSDGETASLRFLPSLARGPLKVTAKNVRQLSLVPEGLPDDVGNLAAAYPERDQSQANYVPFLTVDIDDVESPDGPKKPRWSEQEVLGQARHERARVDITFNRRLPPSAEC